MELLSVIEPNYLISVFNSFVARVGKTSLIMSLVSEEFPEEVERPPLFSSYYFTFCREQDNGSALKQCSLYNKKSETSVVTSEKCCRLV